MKEPEHAMRVDTMIITRLSVIDEDGVTGKIDWGAREIPNTTIPITAGSKLITLLVLLAVERSSPMAAMQNATGGKNKPISNGIFIACLVPRALA